MKRPSINEQRFGELMDRSFAPLLQESKNEANAACGRVLQRLQEETEPVFESAATDLDAGRPSRRWLRPIFAFPVAAVVIVVVILQWPQLDTSGVVVHTTADTGGVVDLSDGSRVEMRAHTQLSLEPISDGIRIRLNEGSVIVNAAKQQPGRHLYVQTKDIRVSVVGTVFLVNTAKEGSHVAVLEGEVRVQQGETEKQLLAGDQVASSPKVELLPVKEEIAWSSQAGEHLALLQQQSAARPVEPRDTFDVISIRRCPGCAGGGGGARGDSGAVTGLGRCSAGALQIDPGRFSIRSATLYSLITLAYGLGKTDGGHIAVRCMTVVGSMKILSGGPDWIAQDTFDVEATIPDGPAVYTGTAIGKAPTPRLERMLQALLADRFKLVLRRETRDMPGYILSVAGTPKLTPAKEGQRGLSTTAYGSFLGLRNSGTKHNYGDVVVGVIQGAGVSMDALKGSLEFTTKKPVLDRTGLTGRYTYEIFFEPAQFFGVTEAGQGRPLLGSPSLFRALEDELGLRLQSSPVPVEVFTIQSAEQPTEN